MTSSHLRSSPANDMEEQVRHRFCRFALVGITAALSSSVHRPAVAHWASVLALLSCADVVAQSSAQIVGDTHRRIEWDEMVDTIVEVDGLAWGAQSKGLGAHLVLPEGQVRLRNIDLIRSDLNGRLLRVSGVLRKARNKRVPQGVQGRSQSFEFFYVDAIEAARIDKVVRPLLPTQDDWIVVGMPIDKATDLIRARRLPGYGLALAASPDGAKAHCYRLGQDEALLYYELDGRVKSVAKVSVSRVARGDDKWTHLVGCRLPRKLPGNPQTQLKK